MVCEVKSLCIKKINDQYELELHFNKWKGKDNVINLVIKKKGRQLNWSEIFKTRMNFAAV